MDDFRKILYGVIIGFIAVIVIWVSFVTFSGCGFSLNNCNASIANISRTPIPSLVPATLPISTHSLASTSVATSGATAAPGETESETTAARPSNPGGPGDAINLKGDPNSGQQIFAANCQVCHAAEGKGGNPNPGSTDGTIPALNPIDPTIANADYKTFATNVDLFVEHGSTPEGVGPTFTMPAWGDQKKLTPQQIADVIAYVISLNPVTNASATEAATPLGGVDIARPSNPGGPGDAVNLKGDPNSGQQIFSANCQVCHAAEGKGGNPNPGSDDGTIPPLNPIDQTIVNADYKTFATNIDLFVQHGSTPSGPSPTFSMPAWGDSGKLTQQQIADVIAYVIGLNPVNSTATTAAPTASGSSSSEKETTAARPSNPGDVGPAVNLTGDPKSGQQIFVANCQTCHGNNGAGGVTNPGSSDGTVPSLDPIDPTIANADYKTFASNVDLFVEHGSTPEGTNPTFSMPAWGDQKKLTPQQIADVIAYVISLNPTTNSPATPAPTPQGGVDVARPSNPGDAGAAVNLTGDLNSGQQIFVANCQTCHGTDGKGGVANPGSNDGTVPPLNPIDATIKNADLKTFAYNIDLFVQHGSTPEGPSPTFSMPPWGDKNVLTQQQIADVIAYLISLNP
jgi:mono/diheme cytochrome c family protein